MVTSTANTASRFPESATVGDINGDGKLDAVATDGERIIRLMLGTGDGSLVERDLGLFEVNVANTVNLHPSLSSHLPVLVGGFAAVQVADVNLDGRLDLVSTESIGINFTNHSFIGVLTNTGNDATGLPQFTATHHWVPFLGARGLTVGDLNGDGRADAVVGSANGQFQVWTNDGAGALSAGQHTTLVPANNASVGPGVIADVSGDGRADFVVTSNQNGGANVFIGNGDGTLQVDAAHLPNDAVSVAAVDVNNDGKLDLLMGNLTTGSEGLLVYVNTGGGTFASPTLHAIPGLGMNFNGGASIAVADINGDGIHDVAMSDQLANRIAVLIGDGTGGFAAPANFPANFVPSHVFVGDFNSDGKPDIGTVLRSTRSVGVLLNTTPIAPPATPPVIFTRSTTTAEGWKKYTVRFTPQQTSTYTLGFNLIAGGPSGDNSILIDAVKIDLGGTTILADGFETPALANNHGISAEGSVAEFGNWEFTNFSGILNNSPPSWGLDAQGLGYADGTAQYAYIQTVFGTFGRIKSESFNLIGGQTYTLTYYQASRLFFGGETTYTVTIDNTVQDRDGDGVQDGQDAFPDDPNESTDSDGDGHGDNGDAFPSNPAEWADADGDGFGNNHDVTPNGGPLPVGVPFDLGTPAGYESYPLDASDNFITGAMSSAPMEWQVFLFSAASGGMTDLGVPAGMARAQGLGVNARGDVVGEAYSSDWSVRRAFYKPFGGAFVDLGPGEASRINDHGVVAGMNGDGQLFRWTAEQGMQVLTAHEGGSVQAASVNAQGDILGMHSPFSIFFAPLTATTATQVNSPVEGGYLEVGGTSENVYRDLALNDAGVVVGTSFYARPEGGYEIKPFKWTAAGGFSYLGALPGGNGGRIFSINNAGNVVGAAFADAGLYQARGFVANACGAVTDLPPLADADFIHAQAEFITNAGVIAGNNYYYAATVWQNGVPGRVRDRLPTGSPFGAHTMRLDVASGSLIGGLAIDDTSSPGRAWGMVAEPGAAIPVDTDCDGAPDDQDAFPNDASEQADADDDGVGDNADHFDDNPNAAAFCSAGSYADVSSASGCTLAPAGSFVAAAGAVSAAPCAAGGFSAAAGATACTSAPAGSFVGATGATASTLCASGSYTSVTGMAACTPAPAGSFVAFTGATSSVPCAPGKFSSAPGASACVSAPAGSFVATAGASTASLCPAGSFSAAAGATSCMPAPANTFVPNAGATSATACAAGLNSDAGATACVDRTKPVITGTPANFEVNAVGTTAVVTYTTPAANDFIGGSRPVSCVPASGSTLPLGTHTVTCTASDAAGNTATTTFTVKVNSLPGSMHGEGKSENGRDTYTFKFRIDERKLGVERGYLEVDFDDSDRDKKRDHSFRSTSISSIAFTDDPAFRSGHSRYSPPADTVVFTGLGKWDGQAGYSFEARATDQGEGRRERDTLIIIIRKISTGQVVATTSGTIDAGNIQSDRLKWCWDRGWWR